MIKRFVKQALRYEPDDETRDVRRIIQDSPVSGRPYAPDDEGDLIFRLITRNNYRHCIETGFGTGSTALYMLAATQITGGSVVSIDWSEQNFNDIGRRTIAKSQFADRHSLIEAPSFLPMSEFLRDKKPIDFVFIDGWKSFDYLAYELFIINRLLRDDGCIMFDDSHLPGVRRAVSLLKHHYGYREIDYAQYGEPLSLRIFQCLTRRSLFRPYRALQKVTPVAAQRQTLDYTFYKPF